MVLIMTRNTTNVFLKITLTAPLSYQMIKTLIMLLILLQHGKKLILQEQLYTHMVHSHNQLNLLSYSNSLTLIHLGGSNHLQLKCKRTIKLSNLLTGNYFMI